MGKKNSKGILPVLENKAASVEGENFKALKPEHQSSLRDMHKKATGATDYINNVSDSIAAKTGGTVAKAPIKKIEKAAQNIRNKYKGDMTPVTDLARNTIVNVTDADAAKSFDLLKNRKDAVRSKFTDAASDPLGYSGWQVKVKASNGLVSEIQVNTPEMIYAKEPEEVARGILGDAKYNQIKKKVKIKGGLGHKFYDEWASLSPAQKAAGEAESVANRSKAYYNAIRAASAQ